MRRLRRLDRSDRLEPSILDIFEQRLVPERRRRDVEHELVDHARCERLRPTRQAAPTGVISALRISPARMAPLAAEQQPDRQADSSIAFMR